MHTKVLTQNQKDNFFNIDELMEEIDKNTDDYSGSKGGNQNNHKDDDKNSEDEIPIDEH